MTFEITLEDGSVVEMEYDKVYAVTYKYTLPVIGEDVVIKNLPLTVSQMQAICFPFPEIDVYNHKVLAISEFKGE